MLTIGNTVFVLVDVQGKLAELMHDKERLFASLRQLVLGLQALRVPVLWLEQNPTRMGETIAPLREILEPETPIAKMSFSGWGCTAFRERLEQSGCRQVLLAGIETHVCVFQTAADLVASGYTVQVVADAVSSRTAANREIGLERIRACGAPLTSVESALFELLRTAEHPAFREVLRLVR